MNYPNWICHECGMKHGNGKRSPISCWHNGKCDICKRETAVTEPRDYGHMKANILWDNKKRPARVKNN